MVIFILGLEVSQARFWVRVIRVVACGSSRMLTVHFDETDVAGCL